MAGKDAQISPTPPFRNAEVNCSRESIFFLLVEKTKVEKNKLKTSSYKVTCRLDTTCRVPMHEYSKARKVASFCLGIVEAPILDMLKYSASPYFMLSYALYFSLNSNSHCPQTGFVIRSGAYFAT